MKQGEMNPDENNHPHKATSYYLSMKIAPYLHVLKKHNIYLRLLCMFIKI